jgi:transcriptional regulator with XRE-family HTH domain
MHSECSNIIDGISFHASVIYCVRDLVFLSIIVNMPEKKANSLNRTRTIGVLLRELRLGRGLSVRQVAKMGDCSPSFLSQVEKARSSPSLATLERIASAFQLDIVELLNLAKDRGKATYLDGTPQGPVLTTWERGRLSHLLPLQIQTTMSLLVLELEPGARTSKRVARQAMKEIGVVLKGRAICNVAGVAHNLGNGEAIYFDLITPHFWSNPTKSDVRILLANPNFTQVFDVEN